MRWSLSFAAKSSRWDIFPEAQVTELLNSGADPSNFGRFLFISHLLQVLYYRDRKLTRRVSPFTQLFLKLLPSQHTTDRGQVEGCSALRVWLSRILNTCS